MSASRFASPCFSKSTNSALQERTHAAEALGWNCDSCTRTGAANSALQEYPRSEGERGSPANCKSLPATGWLRSAQDNNGKIQVAELRDGRKLCAECLTATADSSSSRWKNASGLARNDNKRSEQTRLGIRRPHRENGRKTPGHRMSFMELAVMRRRERRRGRPLLLRRRFANRGAGFSFRHAR